MNTLLHTSPATTIFTCQTLGWATLRVPGAELGNLRRQPGPLPLGGFLPGSFLKQSEDQTVAAVAVVLKAIRHHRLEDQPFRDWGVLAGPTLMGRDATAQSIGRYRNEGPWGISPHMIPHHSLHAVSGTVSQALGMRGPNFGVSGGVHACGEAFLVAATLLSEKVVPGLWLVLTGHQTEKIPPQGLEQNATPPSTLAVALALTFESLVPGGLRIRVAPTVESANSLENLDAFTLDGFIQEIDGATPARHWRLPSAGWVELDGTRGGL